MTSKITKSIASRIPVDLHSQLQKEADELNLNMNDYLLRIICARNEKQGQITHKEKADPKKEKLPAQVQPAKKKLTRHVDSTSEIIFPES